MLYSMRDDIPKQHNSHYQTNTPLSKKETHALV